MPRVAPPDFRRRMIGRRLGRVGTVVLVLSGKGGVGKSVVSATLAALLAEEGRAVGLLDADVYGPSSALILGARAKPREGRAGLVPPVVHGVKVMSVDLFAPGEKMPLTGAGAKELLVEMLALTDWGALDFLVVDMPPATGDVAMLFTSLRPGGLGGLVVTTPDRLAVSVARRSMQMLHDGKVKVFGVLGNMNRAGGESKMGRLPEELAKKFGVPFLGTLPYDPGVLSAAETGNADGLLATGFARRLRAATKALG